MNSREFFLHPAVIATGVILRTLIAALFLCAGMQLFDFKNRASFFTVKKILGLFLLIFGVRLLLSIVLFHTPFD